jgi:hypothetical protein
MQLCGLLQDARLPYSCEIADIIPSIFLHHAYPIHSLLQWMGIWNHRQPVTIALVDPDFDSLLKAWVTMPLLGYKPYHYAVVEAPYPSKAACTSM